MLSTVQLKLTILLVVVWLSGCASSAKPFNTPLPTLFVDKPAMQTDSWAVSWWEPRHNEKLALAASANVDIVMLGDSITHFWETDGADVWQEYYADKNAFNLGFSGDRTEHVLWRLEHGAVAEISPKLVVLMIGTNNTGHRMDPAAYTAIGVSAIVTELRERLPESKILLLGIFPRAYSPYNEMRLRNVEINKKISDLDDAKNIFYLDIGNIFLAADGTIRADLMPDYLHPNAEGYALWAAAMQPAIERLLK
ncbi:platelet-activating factor acetylhydrolase IB subunit [Teredinibacter waterburyi]|uniref:platelet-activating factor acetylhydrolase IB subunit n=1 Tax=Teredinibacter waterburyi TaxID=1500538 RepID=UPI001CAA81B8|nr:platelet-activating factor acetylhydrolase IB subunit [Teredinibacter waterburyi]